VPRVAQGEAADEKKQKHSNHDSYAESSAVRDHESKSGFTVSDRENSFHQVAKATARQDRKHKRPQRYLKDSLRQYENFKWEGRRKNCRDKNAEKCVAVHPLFDFRGSSTGVAMKIRFAALFCEQIEPDTTGKRSDGRHGNVIGHARWIRIGELKDERVSDERK